MLRSAAWQSGRFQMIVQKNIVALLVAGGAALLLAASPANGGGMVDHADGTVSDTSAGLLWKSCSEGQRWKGGQCEAEALPHTWRQARAAAEVSRFGGHDDWRLPRLAELRQLRTMGAERPGLFPDTGLALWSGTAVAHGGDGAFVVNPASIDPEYGVGVLSDGYAVRLVRDAASGAAGPSPPAVPATR
jgi:hypothetical protein